MLKIAIISNNPAHIKSIVKILDTYSANYGELIITDTFQYNMFHEQTNINTYDAFFIDVSTTENIEPGFEIGNFIRRINEDANIILINNNSDKDIAVRGYSINAMSILKQPICYNTSCTIINTLVNKKLSKYNKSVLIKLGNGTLRVCESDIQYIETAGKKTLIHTVIESVECYQRLNSIFAKLSQERFYRCHNSFIVNLDMIKEVSENIIYLGKDIKVPISKNRKKELIKKMAQYHGKRY